MTAICHIDCETKSGLDISAGVDAYVADADYELMIVTYALNDGPVQLWEPWTGAPPPQDLLGMAADPDVLFQAHNARFERLTVNQVLNVPLERWRCTMAQAYAHALPGALDSLCRFLGVAADKQKSAAGKALIKKFCTPPFDDPNKYPLEWLEFLDYAVQDIEAMRECARRMPNVNYPKNKRELNLWFLDQRINDRGFAIDLQLARCALKRVDAEKVELSALISEITGGAVTKGTQGARIQKYLAEECNVHVPNMQKDTLNRLLESGDLKGDALTLLNIRRDASRSSTSKYERALTSQVNGRLYGTSQFCGAGRTGRWAGRLFQPLNLPRPTMKSGPVLAEVEALRNDLPPVLYGSEHDRAADCLRNTIIAGPGKKLVFADWSSIEGRLNAWAAGEQWVIEAYRAGRDMYIETYKSSFGVKAHIEKGDYRRQHGKVLDLSMGYEGGTGALLTMSKTYGLDPVDLAHGARAIADADVLKGARWMWDWARDNGQTHDLDEEIFIGLQCAKIAWRRSRPATKQMWADLRDAMFAALKSHGQVFHVAKCQMMCTGSVLALKLPSGRVLLYANPRISRIAQVNEDGEPDAEIKTRTAVTCSTPYGGRQVLYGGKVAENIAQANSREILAYAMPRVEAIGYLIVLHIYDELAAEVDEDSPLDHHRLERELCVPPPWGPDIPLAAEGITTPRYLKMD